MFIHKLDCKWTWYTLRDRGFWLCFIHKHTQFKKFRTINTLHTLGTSLGHRLGDSLSERNILRDFILHFAIMYHLKPLTTMFYLSASPRPSYWLTQITRGKNIMNVAYFKWIHGWFSGFVTYGIWHLCSLGNCYVLKTNPKNLINLFIFLTR